MNRCNSPVEVIRYSPESRLRQPLRLLREMGRDLRASRELAWRFIVRDISAQYRQTALGYFWAIFPPLVASIIFILLNSSKVINVTGTGLPYPVYVLTGTVFWQLFVDTLNAPLKIVSESKAVILKINFPKESLIISGAGQAFFSFGIKIILLAVVFVVYNIPLKWTALLVPLPIIGLVLIGTMIGILLIPVGLLFKDIQPAIVVATSGLIFLTPVAYPPDVGGLLGKVMNINPLTPVISAVRELMFNGIPANVAPFITILMVSFILLLAGWLVYHLALPHITERLGA